MQLLLPLSEVREVLRVTPCSLIMRPSFVRPVDCARSDQRRRERPGLSSQGSLRSS